MNKKIVMAMVCFLIITTITVNALTTITVTEKRVIPTFDSKKLTILIDYNGISKLDVTTTDFECIENTCYTTFYQKGLINSKVGFAKQNCVTYENITDYTEFDVSSNQTIIYEESNPYSICIDKTTLELTKEMDAYLQERLESYADVQANRASNELISKVTTKVTYNEL